MAFFRSDHHDNYDFFGEPESTRERLAHAQWAHWCGWWKEAYKLLYSVAREVPDPKEQPERQQEDEELSYEEVRFVKENEEHAAK